MTDNRGDPHSDETAKPPNSAALDWTIAVIEAGVSGGASLIPGIGVILSPAAILLGKALRAPIERREHRYVEAIAAGVEALRGRVADIEERIASDAFVTAFLHAGHISMRAHQREKRLALRNAVLNVVAGTAPDDDLQIVFLSLIDQFTPWHLRLLAYLDDPMAWMESHGRAIPPNPSLDGVTLVDYAFPELNLRNSATMIYLEHLATQGLLHDGWNERTSYRARGTRGASRTSELGKQFLAFISSPIPEQEAQEADDNGDDNDPERTPDQRVGEA